MTLCLDRCRALWTPLLLPLLSGPLTRLLAMPRRPPLKVKAKPKHSLRSLFPLVVWAQTLPFLQELAPQQADAVGPATQASYKEHITGFHFWLHERGTKIQHAGDLDQALVMFFQYLEDEQVWPTVGSKTLAAMLHHWPSLGPTIKLAFPGSHRALKGWQRHMPARTRTPMPWAALVAILVYLLAFGHVEAAVMMLTGFSAYLRPRELTSLLTRQLQVPSGPFILFRIWLHPQDQLTPSKTGRWDETIDLDVKYTAFLAPFWRALATGAAFAPQWKVSHTDLLRLCKDACVGLGIANFAQGLCPLRHGGASHDAVFALRSVPAIQDRGRWMTTASLLRYQKKGAAQHAHSTLPKPILDLAAELEQRDLLPRVFNFPQEARELLRRHGLQ